MILPSEHNSVIVFVLVNHVIIESDQTASMLIVIVVQMQIILWF
jgi:hypothetical protein